MKESAEMSQAFLALMEEWQVLEDKTIVSADELIRKANNPLVETVMDMIKHDSAKHKAMLKLIIDNLTRQSVHLSPDELSTLASLLNKHMEVEANSIALANDALKQSELPITRYILTALLDDEQKHHNQLHMLAEELKKPTIFVA
jgi:hypothetical protein